MVMGAAMMMRAALMVRAAVVVSRRGILPGGMGGPIMLGCVAMMTMVTMPMRHHPAEDLGGLGLAQGKLRLVAQAHGKGAAPQQPGGNDHQRDAIGKSEVSQAAAHHGVQVAKNRVGHNALDVHMRPFVKLG